MLRYRELALVGFFVLVLSPGLALAEDELFDPVAIFLTWQQDPTTTMTIDWHTTPEDERQSSVLQYKPRGGEQWHTAEGTQHAFPHSDRTIHRVELTGLDPATRYRFRFGDGSKAYQFETMPENLIEPLRFATGGDTDIGERFTRMNRVAMEYDLDFIVWGGDLAYANGDPRRVERWYGWFDGIKHTLIDDEGRVVPIVLAIGNHELFGTRRLVREGLPEDYAQQEWGIDDDHVTFFYDLFAFPGDPAYGVLDFADYLSLIILDTDHGTDVVGEQTEWLAQMLQEREDIPHVFPVYHVPAYPSARTFYGGTSTRVRENWVPLFEQYGVRVAFENHDHTYKRTHPMLADDIHPNGIVYIGDGNWGQRPRERYESEHQDRYLKQFAAVRHGIVVTLHGPHQHYLAVDEDGEVIDEYPRTPRRAGDRQ